MCTNLILWIREFRGGRAPGPRAESKLICLIIAQITGREGTEVARAQAPLTSQSSGDRRLERYSQDPSFTLPYPQWWK